MWKQMKMPICGIIMLLLSAASMATKSSAETMAPNASLCSDVSSNYYIVTRLDPRMCPAPICGGYFVKEVNKPKTKCADGTWQRDCHAGQPSQSGQHRRMRGPRRFGVELRQGPQPV